MRAGFVRGAAVSDEGEDRHDESEWSTDRTLLTASPQEID